MRPGLLAALCLVAAGAAADEPPGPSVPVAAAVPGGPQQLDLDAAAIRGNQELPKVLYIVPWKDPALVELTGRPVNSLVEEVLAPVDREVFRRQGRYFEQLYAPAGEDVSKSPSRGKP